MKYKKVITYILLLIILLPYITYADFDIIPRSKWGADESLQDKSKFNNINCELNNTCNKLSKEQYDNQLNFVLQQVDLFKNKTLKEILLEKSKGIFKDIHDSIFFIFMQNIFPDIEDYAKIIKQADGYNLWWPRAYSKKISKIIIHHTAEGSKTDLNGDGIIDDKDFQLYQDTNNDGIIDENDYKELVRKIYKYHTLKKAWGDIGYNFIIDPAGNIYEGRAGGDYVIGGHVLYGNTNTIGIAVIGNYDIYNLNDKIKNSLINLLAELCRKYNIDPQGKSYFRNTYMYNIAGHKDLNNTNCPGKNIYNELDNIRIAVSNALNQPIKKISIDTNNINEDQAYKLIAQKQLNAFSDIIREQSYPIESHRPKLIKFELLNSSTIFWNTGTYVKFQPNKNIKFLNTNAYLKYNTAQNKYGKFELEIIPLIDDDTVLEGNLVINENHFSPQPIKLWLQRDLKNVKLKFEGNDNNIYLSPDTKTKLKIYFKNIGIAQVGRKTPNKIYISPADDNTKTFYEPSSWILPRMIVQNNQDYVDTDELGFFEFYLSPNGIGDKISFQIRSIYSDQLVNQDIITFNIIKSDKNLQADNSGIYYKNINMNKIRIKLDFANTKANIKTNKNYILMLDEKKIDDLFDSIEISLNKSKLSFNINNKEYTGNIIRFIPKSENQIITIENMDKKSSTNPNIKYNQFRNILELQLENEKIIAINELSIFDYMKGIAETTPDTPYEKMKAIAIAAKNYAIYYTDKSKRKFPNKPYDLDSDPNNSQYYLGYGYEKVSNNWVKAVEDTINEIIVFDNKLIKTPYFSSSNGYTKSAYEVWGWKDTPYLISVEDPYCKGMQQKGHGVGMSGCGSKGMAENGKNYKEILKYYYSGIEIIKIE